MLKHITEYHIANSEWGDLDILRVIPVNGNIWGDLVVLKDTVWGDLIPVVSGESLSNALHGYVIPLMREIGPNPHNLFKKIPQEIRLCSQSDDCIMFNKKDCYASPSVPDCYISTSVKSDALDALSMLIVAWKKQKYVILVSGKEFS